MSAPAAAQCEVQKLLPDDVLPGQKFALDVDQSGNFAIAGAPFDVEAGTSAGSAYILERGPEGWSTLTKHIASDAEDLDRTGWRVAIDGGTAISTTRYSEDAGYGTGAVYVIEQQPDDQWIEVAKLLADDASSNTFFGNDADVDDGGLIVVGAPSDTTNGPKAGSAYVFQRGAGGVWTQQAKLYPSEVTTEDNFGYSVSINGHSLAIGAWGHDSVAGVDSGAVFTFEFQGGAWVETNKLLASDAAPHSGFGIDVDLASERLVVGAHLDDGLAEDAGAAYIYDRVGSTWFELSVLRAGPTGLPSDHFGETVSIAGERLLVGAFSADAVGANSGAAYHFERE